MVGAGLGAATTGVGVGAGLDSTDGGGLTGADTVAAGWVEVGAEGAGFVVAAGAG